MNRDLYRDQRVGQRACDAAQFTILALLTALYLVAPRAVDAYQGGSLTLWILLAYLGLTALRLTLNTYRQTKIWLEYVWVVADFGLLYALILSYHLQYDAPPGIVLKATTAGMAFFLIAIRAVIFDIRLLVFSGGCAIIGWIALSGYAALAAGPGGLTRSFVEYMTSARILVGAQVEHILSLGLVTFALSIAVGQIRTDSLTGLPNRKAFLQRLDRRARGSRARGGAVVLVEIDNLHDLANSFGEQMAEAALIEAAERVRTFAGAWGTPARLEAGVFAVMSAGVVDGPGALRAADRLAALLAAPMASAGAFRLRTFVAVALHNEDADGVAMLRNANAALNRARVERSSAPVAYVASFSDDARHRIELERDLRTAIERGELAVHYQPIVTLTDGAIVGAEALVRWTHPERGSVSPADFIPVAEATGLIVDIGGWVLDQVVADQARWRAEGADLDFFVSVNVAPAQLWEWRRLDAAASRAAAARASIRYEVTESAMAVDDLRLIDRLHALAERSAGLAIDDFGTGYSSFSRLNDLPFSTLKIDRAFTMQAGAEAGRATLEALARLAGGLRMDTVVEGVETVEQQLVLRALGFRLAQGFLFGRAAPGPEFQTRWLTPAARRQAAG